jgi:hypothetical protein
MAELDPCGDFASDHSSEGGPDDPIPGLDPELLDQAIAEFRQGGFALVPGPIPGDEAGQGIPRRREHPVVGSHAWESVKDRGPEHEKGPDPEGNGPV